MESFIEVKDLQAEATTGAYEIWVYELHGTVAPGNTVSLRLNVPDSCRQAKAMWVADFISGGDHAEVLWNLTGFNGSQVTLFAVNTVARGLGFGCKMKVYFQL